MVACVAFSRYTFILLFYVISLLGLGEFYRLLESPTAKPRKILGYILSSFLFASIAFTIINAGFWKILLLNIPFAFLIFVAELYLRAPTPFLNLAVTFLGIIYVTVPCVFVVSLAFIPFLQTTYHPYSVIGYFLIIWANDSGAYLFGKYFGKRHLFERISPNKTWVGSFAGAACAIASALVISNYSFGLTKVHWLLATLICIVTGTFGDLIKSLLKRSVNVKDSGTILPGHGGILDRFDSMLSSAPFVFCYLLFFV